MAIEREKSCCFSGHRYIPRQELDIVREKLKQQIIALYQKGVTNFIAGGAIGFDTLAAETVVGLRPEYPGLTLTLALPCRNQEVRWKTADKNRYQALLKAADHINFLSEEYTPLCMQGRNRYMVDHSSCCMFYLLRPGSGTGMTVKYAIDQDLKLINILN